MARVAAGRGHLEPCQNPISGHDDPISVYPDIGPDIGHDIADTRYRVMTRYRDQYRDIPISGPTVPISCQS